MQLYLSKDRQKLTKPFHIGKSWTKRVELRIRGAQKPTIKQRKGEETSKGKWKKKKNSPEQF